MWFKLALVIGSVITIHASAINIHAKANGNKTLDDNVDLADLLNRVESLEEKVKTFNEGSTNVANHILMYVRLSSSMTDVSNHVTIIFDQPLINPGDHYNQHDGIYVSPFSGKIMVYWTIGTDESAKTELMVEDRVIATLITSASSVSTSSNYGNSRKTTKQSSSSTVAVADVQKGDHVFLRTASDDNHILGSVSSVLIKPLY